MAAKKINDTADATKTAAEDASAEAVTGESYSVGNRHVVNSSDETAAAIEPLVYIGPTIYRTRLVQNAVFKGTRAGVEEFLKSELAAYPKAERLIVPVSELAAARIKITSTGNILGRTYAELAGKKQEV